jgi:class 3 adenylate cyclase
LREVIGAYRRCCTDLVTEAGGFVAKYMGDGVLAYFGWEGMGSGASRRKFRCGLDGAEHVDVDPLDPSADQGSVDRQDHGRESCVSRHARAGPHASRAGVVARVRERYARDARAAALMCPWTQEIATQQAWEAALGLDGQQGGAAGA